MISTRSTSRMATPSASSISGSAIASTMNEPNSRANWTSTSSAIAKARLASLATCRSRTTASPVTSSDSSCTTPRVTTDRVAGVDVDVFVAAHAAEWNRLGELTGRGGKLTGPEADELVTLYQRTATHLSIVRSVAPDPALVGRLSGLVARGRSAVSGAHNPAWREVTLFFTRRFPAAVYLSRRWWIPAALASIAVMAVIAVWVARDPNVRAAIATPDELNALTKPGGEAETYYSTGPAASFAAQVWTNNAWVTATCLFLGIALGLPVIAALWSNTLNLGIGGGLMTAAGRGDVFLGLILPHGLLELTAVF